MTLRTIALMAFWGLVAASVAGCSVNKEPEKVPFLINVPPPDIPTECDPRLRANLKPIEKSSVSEAPNMTPLKSLEGAYLDARLKDLKNEVRETSCYCTMISGQGYEEERARSERLCRDHLS